MWTCRGRLGRSETDLVRMVSPDCFSTIARPCSCKDTRRVEHAMFKGELTRPTRDVCADTAAKGVSAGSAESIVVMFLWCFR